MVGNEAILGQFSVSEIREMGELKTRKTISILKDPTVDEGVIVSTEEQEGNVKDIHQVSYPSLESLKKAISNRSNELNKRLETLGHRKVIAERMWVGGPWIATGGLIGFILHDHTQSIDLINIGLGITAFGGFITYLVGSGWGENLKGNLESANTELGEINSIDKTVQSINPQPVQAQL